ncbi:MAG: putative Ig domain-containing protein [Nitrospirota bacterium]
MKYRVQVLTLFILVILCPFLFSSAHAYVFTPENPVPGPNSIYLSYNPTQSIGATLALDVKVNSLSDTTPAFGAAFDLDFDPAVLTFAGFVKGDYFQDGDIIENGSVMHLVVLQPGTSNKLIVGVSQNAGDTGASGSGVVLTLKFTVASGEQTLQSNITLSNTNILDTQGAVINGISWQNGLLTQSPLIIATTSLPETTQGGSYSTFLAASGGFPLYLWNVSGVLPPGLGLDTLTGNITGMPLQSGVYIVKIQLTDSALQVATKDLTIVVNQPPVILTTSVPEATVGRQVSQSLAASGGKSPLNWSISQGILPQGILLDSSTCVLSGIAAVSGPFTFTVKLEDVHGVTDTVILTMIVNAEPAITTTSLSDTTAGANYIDTLQVSGGTATYSWEILTGLPPGLNLINETGEIIGIPSASGNWQFTVTVRDINGASISKNMQILVNPAIEITTSSTVNLYQGASGSNIVFTASGGTAPYSWVVSGNLPAGLVLDGQTGIVSGTPVKPGIYTFTLQITDATGVSSSVTYTWAILANPPGNVDFTTIGSENRVDGYDLISLSMSWEATNGSPGWNPLADLNSDGIINGADISILQTNFGKSVSP